MERKSAMRRGRLGTWVAMAIAAAFACVSPAVAQKLYKWTDENGKVHYTDKAPDPSRGGTQLDKQGRPVGRIEPAPTPEQVRAKEAEAERKKAAAKEQEVSCPARPGAARLVHDRGRDRPRARARRRDGRVADRVRAGVPCAAHEAQAGHRPAQGEARRQAGPAAAGAGERGRQQRIREEQRPGRAEEARTRRGDRPLRRRQAALARVEGDPGFERRRGRDGSLDRRREEI
ncbi:MAG: DUF4124 domain-containing protein, partial [Betaproteobacteria bacterium]|nr:DUF4124 domain-containing protein [Betaproteobacteria bacterium]